LSFIASTVCKKYKRAVIEQKTSSEYYDAFTRSCPQDKIPEWTRDIEAAEAGRDGDPTVMDTMKTKVKKRESSEFLDIL
jgi:hypothetical protein